MKTSFLKTLSTLAIITLGMTATMSHASNSCGNETTIFSCKTNANKIIKICQSDDNLTYNYGKKGKTELSLKRSLKNVKVLPLGGTGFTYNYGIEFKNGNTGYSVYSSKERGEHGELSGVLVVSHGDKTTRISCAKDIYDDSFNIVKPHM